MFRALRKLDHRIQGSRIGITAAYSWNQYNAEKASSKNKHGNYAVSKINQIKAKTLSVDAKCAGLNSLSLNDDWLENTCGLLELRDRVNFTRVCARFQEIFTILS